MNPKDLNIYNRLFFNIAFLNPIQQPFQGCSWMRESQKAPPSLKSATHILQQWNLAQLYLTQRRSKKYMNQVTHPLNSADISIFSLEISKFCHIKKYRYRLHFDISFLILVTFFESLKVVLIKMITILMMSAKNGCFRPS